MTDDIIEIGSKCYIVFANGGQWEGSWSKPIKAFRTEEEATRYKEYLEKSIPEFSEHLHKLMSRIDVISYRAAIKFADESSEEFYQIYNSIYEPLRHKAELNMLGTQRGRMSVIAFTAMRGKPRTFSAGMDSAGRTATLVAS